MVLGWRGVGGGAWHKGVKGTQQRRRTRRLRGRRGARHWHWHWKKRHSCPHCITPSRCTFRAWGRAGVASPMTSGSGGPACPRPLGRGPRRRGQVPLYVTAGLGKENFDWSSSGEKQRVRRHSPPANDPPWTHHRESMGLVAACRRSSSSVAADDRSQTDRGQRQSWEIARENYTKTEKSSEKEAITVKCRVWLLGGSHRPGGRGGGGWRRRARGSLAQGYCCSPTLHDRHQRRPKEPHGVNEPEKERNDRLT